MNLPLSFNNFQTSIAILQPKYTYIVGGRGVGKSALFGYMLHKIVDNMPGASGVIGAKTFTHVLTSILPSAFAHLERMGYIRNIHYFIGEKPPKSWGLLPYQPPVKDFKSYITIFNPERPVGFYLVSQDREGSGRGPNTDFLLTDETLRLDKQKLDRELSPTLRANKDKFGKIHYHLGEYHSTSMPYTNEAKWILDKGNYYMEDYGIDYFTIWKNVIKLQLELLDISNEHDFLLQWNEIQRLRRQMKPMLSKDDKTLFVLTNAFDNIENVGLSYIKNQRERLPEIEFLIEIMNDLIYVTDNAYYILKDEIHIYNDSWNEEYAFKRAIDTGYNFNEIGKQNSAFLNLKYYNPDIPIHLFFDWGGSISFCLAAQYDKASNTLYIIKEFYVLPQAEMPKNLMKQVCEFFFPHNNKTIIFLKDTLGDDKSRSIQTKNTINEDAVHELKIHSWKVRIKKHTYKEPPQHEKWQMMQKVMHEGEVEKLFKLRIDGNNCKYLIIAMRQTKVKQVGTKLEKDKSLERKSSIDQRSAPHSTDALDKGCYWLTKNKSDNEFIDISIR